MDLPLFLLPSDGLPARALSLNFLEGLWRPQTCPGPEVWVTELSLYRFIINGIPEKPKIRFLFRVTEAQFRNRKQDTCDVEIGVETEEGRKKVFMLTLSFDLYVF